MTNEMRGTCLRKKGYSEETIDKIIKTIKRKEGTTLYKYICKFCYGFHLTKMNPEIFKQKEENNAITYSR